MAKARKLPKFVKLVRPKKQVKTKFDVKGFAEVAAKSAAEKNEIGQFIESVTEGSTTTYFWEAKQPGYGGWRWSVTVDQIDPSLEPTLTEVVLVPGPDALIAPNWIPWKDRVVDTKHLQDELDKTEGSDELDLSDDLVVLDSEPSENSEQ
ncbi:MAG: hypothetical protein RIQ88_701 [Actinomycetota bacterium]|jgi:Protein of unknown function (DUF3027)